MNAKSLKQKEAQLNAALENGQFFRNGNGITFEVTFLDANTIGMDALEFGKKPLGMARSLFVQLLARNNYEQISSPKASREFELTKTLGLNRFSVR